jgi:Na+/proline symporter
MGTALFVFYRANPELLYPFEKSDQLVPWFIATSMPAGLDGLVIAGVFAAAMSSLDSSMHAAATAVTTDFVRRLSPGREEASLLRLARALTIAFGFLGTGTAMLMATADIRFLWDFFIGLMGLFGGTLAGLFALGIFVPRTGAVHAWCGAAASLALLVVVRSSTDLHPLLYGVIGTGTCMAVGAIASLALPGKVRARA